VNKLSCFANITKAMGMTDLGGGGHIAGIKEIMQTFGSSSPEVKRF
jgi:hypothetical protein